AGRDRRQYFGRDSQPWAAPCALSRTVKDAAAGQSHRGGYQLGSHPSDAATHTAWALTSAQASSVSFCTFAITLGGMMSGQNFPAESWIHPPLSLAPLRSALKRLASLRSRYTSSCCF